MTRHLLPLLALGAALVSALALPSAPLAAQAGRSPAVVVAITDTLTSNDARAILMRAADHRDDIIILKRATATPEILGAALALMNRLRAQSPTPRGLEVARMQGGVARQPLAGAELSRLTATLRHLDAQPTVRIGNLGAGQWVKLASTTATP